MLYEIIGVDQDSVEFDKRWFFDDDIDLMIWLDADNEIAGFQLCYDKLNNPHALTWFRDKGYSHNRIDFREDKIGRRRGSPILVADGVFEVGKVLENFTRCSKNLEPWISTFVQKNTEEFALIEK